MRPLNEKGITEAEKMSRKLIAYDVLPEFIVSSSAKRALSTAIIFAQALGIDEQSIQQDNKIYEADLSSLRAIVNELPDSKQRIALVGHNPGITYLAEYLSGEYIGNMPTAGIIHIQFEIDEWALISHSLGKIKWQESP